MNRKSLTIDIVIPSGDVSGVRIINVNNSKLTGIMFPRSKTSDFLERQESKEIGVYILIDKTIDKTKKAAAHIHHLFFLIGIVSVKSSVMVFLSVSLSPTKIACESSG